MAEVSVTDGKIKVHRMVCAVDCGQYVNPGIIAAQIEGGAIFGASAALFQELTFENGRLQQTNFNTFPVMRMNECPEIETYIVESNEKSGGIGEPGVPCAAPAIANALFAATGKRVAAATHGPVGGRMKNFLPIRPSTTVAILALGSTLLLSQPFAAAEPPSKSSAAAAPSARDGSLFTAFVPVLRHPRCINCHSMGDFPRQGDDGHPHAMNVRRGAEGHGVTAEKCSTCHQDHNLERYTSSSRRAELGPASRRRAHDLAGPDGRPDLPVNQRPKAQQEPGSSTNWSSTSRKTNW